MARIAGVDIPKNKRGVIALTYVYGIGRNKAKKILDAVEIDENIKVQDWTDEQINNIRVYIDQNVSVEGILRSEVQMNIKRLIDIGSYRGLRHRQSLPARGQNTRNNSRTRKGKKRTVANKKKAPK